MIIDSEFIKANAILLYALIGLFSIIIGSLLNLIIYRLPRMIHEEELSHCHQLLYLKTLERQPLNLFLPRSFCPFCKNTIKAIHNIPILSFLILKGQCYYCKHHIPARYPFIEFLSGCLGVLATWHFGFTAVLPFALIFIGILITILFIDVDFQLLPDSLSLSLLWLGLIANTQSLFTSLSDAVLSAAIAYLILWIFIKLFYLATGKVGMGHGDFKLFAAFGAWFGWVALPLILFLSSIMGAIVGLIYLKVKNKTKDTPIPFGPFLCVAGFVFLFWGDNIVSYYLSFVGLK